MSSLLRKAVQRSTFPTISVDQWVQFFEFGGLAYPFTNIQQTLNGKLENADNSFEGLSFAGLKGNGVVFACMVARQMLFSEARFQWRQRVNGRPGDLFGSPALSILEHPWPGGVTADLLARAIQDVDLAGNFFVTRRKGKLRRLRPSWVTIVLGSTEDPNVEAGDIDAEVVGYIYHQGGRGSDRKPILLLREEVAHFAPIPDPTASFRGMSWLVPILREFLSDSGMITHKMKFLENGATPNMVVTMDPTIKKEAFKEWVQMFSEKHEGALNAYKTLYLGAGSHLDVVGKDFRQMDFAVTQAAGELRIASAAGVPPSVIGLQSGIKSGGSLNAGNFTAHKRLFADGTMRPLWRNIATSLEILVPPPNSSAYLWYDDRDIPFLREDIKDAAEVQQANSAAIKSLIDSGFEPDVVVDAIMSGDLMRLKAHHTGLFSVQLQPPGTKLNGTTDPNAPAEPPSKKPEPQVKSAREEALELFSQFLERQIPTAPPHVTIAAPPAPSVEVNINEGALRVDAPVTVERTEVKVDAPVTLAEGSVRVDAPVTIERGAVEVQVEQPNVEVNVPPPPPRKRRKVKRETEFRADELGRIIGKSETEEELDDDSQPL